MAFLRLTAPWALLLLVCCGGACSRPAASPDEALSSLQGAVKRGDASALHGRLNREAQKELQVADIERIIAEARPELAAQLARFAAADCVVEQKAEVVLSSGRTVEVRWEDGGYRLAEPGFALAAYPTPAAALGALRDAVAARDYHALLAALSDESGALLDESLRTLVADLASPEALVIEIKGGQATVTTDNGHRIVLEQEDGTWKIRDFE